MPFLHWCSSLIAHLHMPFPAWLVSPISTSLYKIDKASEKVEDIVSTPGIISSALKERLWTQSFIEHGKPIARTPLSSSPPCPVRSVSARKEIQSVFQPPELNLNGLFPLWILFQLVFLLLCLKLIRVTNHSYFPFLKESLPQYLSQSVN